MTEEFATSDEVHEEIDTEVVLIDIVHAHNEGVLDSVEDVFLKLEALEEVLVNHKILADALHGV